MMKNKTIFIACDTSNINQIKRIIRDTKTNKLKIIPKFGLQFFYSKNGRKFLERFKSEFFLDVKLKDIPQTALSALDSLKDLKKLKYITVHASGGLEMLKAVTRKAKRINPRFGVGACARITIPIPSTSNVIALLKGAKPKSHFAQFEDCIKPSKASPYYNRI